MRTIRSARGVEFPVVMICLKTVKDPDRILTRSTADADAEESGIYHVAASRAQNVLYIHVPTLSPERGARAEQLAMNVTDVDGSCLASSGRRVPRENPLS